MAAMERSEGIGPLAQARGSGTSIIHDWPGSVDHPQLSRLWKIRRAAVKFWPGIVAREQSECDRSVVSNVASE